MTSEPTGSDLADEERERLLGLVENLQIPTAPAATEVRRRADSRRRTRHAVVGSAAVVVLIVLGAISPLGSDIEIMTGPSTESASQPEVRSGWVWHDSEQIVSRDGSPSGYATRVLPDAAQVVIVLGDAATCLSPQTCAESPERFGADEFSRLMSRSTDLPALAPTTLAGPDSQFADADIVWIPLVTGDMHLGSTSDATVAGVDEPQQFVGRRNVSAVLDDLEQFDWLDPSQRVLLMGSGAGGIGAIANYTSVAERFGDRDVALLVDDAPLFPTGDVFRRCQASAWISTFGLTRPERWPGDLAKGPDAIGEVYSYLSRLHPEASMGLIVSPDDAATRRVYTTEIRGCAPRAGELAPTTYAVAAEDLAARVSQLPSWTVVLSDTGDALDDALRGAPGPTTAEIDRLIDAVAR